MLFLCYKMIKKKNCISIYKFYTNIWNIVWMLCICLQTLGKAQKKKRNDFY